MGISVISLTTLPVLPGLVLNKQVMVYRYFNTFYFHLHIYVYRYATLPSQEIKSFIDETFEKTLDNSMQFTLLTTGNQISSIFEKARFPAITNEQLTAERQTADVIQTTK